MFLIYVYIYNARSICEQQSIHSLKAYQHRSDEMKILKDQSVTTTARVVSVAYGLWLATFLDQQSAQVEKIKERKLHF